MSPGISVESSMGQERSGRRGRRYGVPDRPVQGGPWGRGEPGTRSRASSLPLAGERSREAGGSLRGNGKLFRFEKQELIQWPKG